ncbi:MAG: flagellar basal body-associated FliL family protein [Sedimentisphaerales bacterium]|nr:flagellar basal body-associated FliL family protein [Sedimentisphaerales bacterium]
MADEEEIKQSETPEKEEKEEKKGKKGKKDDKKTEAGEKKSLIARFLPKVIIVLVVVIFGGAGFTLARLLAGSPASLAAGGAERGQSENMDAEDSGDDSGKSWYYHMEPVIANLDVDDVTRYVKASLTLEVSVEVDEKEGTAFIDAKKPILTNWLTVYLASLHLEDIRGDSNLKRIQSHVMDAYNEKLFPDSKPKIKNVLFKEFAVQ